MRCLATKLSVGFLVLGLCLPWTRDAGAAEVFNDEFEGCTDNGSCSTGTAWDSSVDTDGDATCAGGVGDPVYTGSKSCEIIVDNATVAEVREDGALATEADIGMRFYLFLKADTDYVTTNAFQILNVFNEAADNQVGHISLQNVGTNSLRRLQGMVENDDATQQTTDRGRVLAHNRWYCVEYYSYEATTTTSNDGILRLYVDGRLQGEILNADNNALNFGEIRFGASGSLDAGTTNLTLYLDAVVLRDDTTRIGCLGLRSRAQPSVGMLEMHF